MFWWTVFVSHSVSISFVGALAVQSVVLANIGNLTTEVTLNDQKQADYALHAEETTFIWNIR
jgi:hypothetical protein